MKLPLPDIVDALPQDYERQQILQPLMDYTEKVYSMPHVTFWQMGNDVSTTLRSLHLHSHVAMYVTDSTRLACWLGCQPDKRGCSSLCRLKCMQCYGFILRGGIQ